MTAVSNSTGNQIKEQIGIGFIGKRIPVAKNICYLGLATVWNDASAEAYCLGTSHTNEKETSFSN